MIQPTSFEAPEMHMLPRSAGYDQKVGHVVNPWSMGSMDNPLVKKWVRIDTFQTETTPQKSNMDTNNCHIWMELPFPSHHFGALQPLVFGGRNSSKPIVVEVWKMAKHHIRSSNLIFQVFYGVENSREGHKNMLQAIVFTKDSWYLEFLDVKWDDYNPRYLSFWVSTHFQVRTASFREATTILDTAFCCIQRPITEVDLWAAGTFMVFLLSLEYPYLGGFLSRKKIDREMLTSSSCFCLPYSIVSKTHIYIYIYIQPIYNR